MFKTLLNSNRWLWTAHVSPKAYDLVRIGVSLAALFNLIDLWMMRHNMFYGKGLIDRELLVKIVGERPYFSVFHYLETTAAVDVAFILFGIACVMLMLGFCSKLSAAVVFLFHLSYCNYAFIALHGWDVILRIFSFLLIISPIGYSWSLDNLLRRRFNRPLKDRVMVYGLTLMQLQVFVIYFETFWLKVAKEYWRNGEFISYFMLSSYSRFPSEFWAEQQVLSMVLTYGTLAFEASIGFLLLHPDTRKFAMWSAFAFHISLAVCGQLFLFSFTMLAVLLAFSSYSKHLETETITSARTIPANTINTVAQAS